jgi:hypothetical protein
MTLYQYVNDKHRAAQVVVGGNELGKVPPNDFKLFAARPEEEMEVYVKVSPRQPRHLVESGTVRELAVRVRLV